MTRTNKKILVVQQVPHEGLGTLAPMLRNNGFEADFVHVWQGEPVPRTIDAHSALIVLGGPMGVYEEERCPYIKDELRLINSALNSNTPMLGICLGAQLIARAAGARVYKGERKEIGWYPLRINEAGENDALLKGVAHDITVFQWHGDTFDIPANAVNLASSELFPNQLLRVGTNGYGLQFHLEVTDRMVREWMAHNAEELEGLKGVIDPAKIVRDTPGLIRALNGLGETIFSKFLRLIDI